MSSVQQNVIKHKVGLLSLAAELGNVSRACKVMGFSRDTFYNAGDRSCNHTVPVKSSSSIMWPDKLALV